MRLSALPDFPGYDEWLRLTSQSIEPRVFLNGAKMKDAVAADDQAGSVIVYLRDKDGHHIYGATGLAMETRKGHVRIELPVVHDSF